MGSPLSQEHRITIEQLLRQLEGVTERQKDGASAKGTGERHQVNRDRKQGSGELKELVIMNDSRTPLPERREQVAPMGLWKHENLALLSALAPPVAASRPKQAQETERGREDDDEDADSDDAERFCDGDSPEKHMPGGHFIASDGAGSAGSGGKGGQVRNSTHVRCTRRCADVASHQRTRAYDIYVLQVRLFPRRKIGDGSGTQVLLASCDRAMMC